ncbi:hypothetical protein MC885_019367, partial [Smutsia gigantea]
MDFLASMRPSFRSCYYRMTPAFARDNSPSSVDHSQGLEKQGVQVCGAVEASPLVSAPAQSAKKPQ